MGADDIRKRFARKFTLEMWKAVTTLTTLNLLKKKEGRFQFGLPCPCHRSFSFDLGPLRSPLHTSHLPG